VAFMGYKSTSQKARTHTHEFLSLMLCVLHQKQPWVSLKRVYDDTQASGPLTLGLMAVITTNLGAFAFGLSSHTHDAHSQSVSPDAESVKRAHTPQQISAFAWENAAKEGEICAHQVSFSRKFQ
jgi:hypothetical protein